MSRPTAISPEEQEQIARRIGVLLLQAAPEDWQQITVEYRATGEYHDLLGEVATQQGGGEPWEPPEELVGIFEHLREGMYRPDVGTWLSALYIVEKPSSYRIDINFDTEPRWRRPLPRAAYVDELRRYPRTDENVPDWLRERLEGSGATAQQAAPAEAAASADVAAQADAAGQPDSAAQAEAAAAGATQVNGTAAPSQQETASAPEEPVEVAPHFRTAAAYDDLDDHGRPVVSARTPVPPDQVAALRQYLENAPIVLASRDNEPDRFDDNRPTTIPATWHTDGVWLWPGSVAYYLSKYGVPPQTEFVEHIRSRRFTLLEIDDRVRDAATRELFERSAASDQRSESTQPETSEAQETADSAETNEAAQASETAEAAEATSVAASQEAEGTTARADEDVHTPVGEVEPHEEDASEQGNDAATTSEDHAETEHDAAEHDAAEAQDQREEAGLVDEDRDSESQSADAEVTTARADAAQVDEDPATGSRDTGAETAGAEGADVETPEISGQEAQPVVDPRSDAESAEASHEDVLAMLHDKLTEFRVDPDSYRVGSHSTSARCLLKEGPDWVVTAAADDRPSEDVRFSHPAQAAAYLLGTLLLSGSAGASTRTDQPSAEAAAPVPESSVDRDEPAEDESARAAEESTQDESAAVQPEAARSEAAQDEAGKPEAAQNESAQSESAQAESAQTGTGTDQQPASSPESELPRRAPSAPERPRRSETGGHFLFTANQGTPPEIPESDPLARRDVEPAAQHEGTHGEEATRFNSVPLPPRPAAAPEQPPTQALRTGPPQGGAPGQVAPAPGTPAQGTPAQGVQGQPPQGQAAPPQSAPGQAPQGQNPPPLPKRSPRPDQAGRPPAGGPGQQGPMGGERRPGPAGAGMGGPARPAHPGPPSGPLARPPQPGPGDPAARPPQQGQPQQPPQGQPAQPQANGQQIQPLRGEPPLTLYRDRRPIMLQPGTDLDRFGEPSGNVTYAIRTPFSQRSLPPQWSSRPYLAYRVQRPLQVLRGTAVPWFEQSGGGTAYVLPASISELIADGTLFELTGNEAPPRPAME